MICVGPWSVHQQLTVNLKRRCITIYIELECTHVSFEVLAILLANAIFHVSAMVMQM